MGNGVINNGDLPEDAQMFVSESHEGVGKNRMQFDIMKETGGVGNTHTHTQKPQTA